jgi:hypothetical protein
MASVYEDAADYIVANALAVKTGAGQNIWGGNMPSRPDFMIGVFEQPGPTSDWAMGRRVIDEMTLQVLVRDVSTATARDRAFAIFSLFSSFNFLPLAQRVLNGVQYHTIMPKHPPYPLGQDENNRFRWSCHYAVKRGA